MASFRCFNDIVTFLIDEEIRLSNLLSESTELLSNDTDISEYIVAYHKELHIYRYKEFIITYLIATTQGTDNKTYVIEIDDEMIDDLKRCCDLIYNRRLFISNEGFFEMCINDLSKVCNIRGYCYETKEYEWLAKIDTLEDLKEALKNVDIGLATEMESYYILAKHM